MASEGRLAGKVAIVTGGASGIGLATVRRFVAEGAKVAVGDLAADGLKTVEAELGDAVVGVRGDVSQEADVEALAQAAVDRFGRLDLAYANAGIGSIGAIVDIDPKDWMRVIEVDLLGPLLTIKHAARRMTDGGSIVATASLNATQPSALMSAYCSAKAGLAMLVQVAALELGPARIRVNAVGPGLVKTPLTEPMSMVPGLIDEFDANAPMATTTSPDDVASLVTFLASDESTSISGTLQLIDRGAHTQRYPDLVTLFGATTTPAGTEDAR